ncbi:hypothetical protein PISMIDRAFT_106388 [Pisolithus microcarpus 441]|uniref:Uncharacterized protein n=1 Tax=Pisolithus microcarpus 441 TaxID=765257 RepID=A0A0C9Z1C8_9AGAM|nr:hypothetical protein BKA83DRAFT_106388 [Pisolithus microcarpus]KIK20094.1 hypothetical protein PISMIDRAFT_106388 [Pisolithus microcarpus 441]
MSRAWISRTRAGTCIPRHVIASTSNTRSTTTDASTKYGNANTESTTSSAGDDGRDPQLSQGHVADPAQRHPQDPLSQAARKEKAKDTPPLDAAASATEGGLKAPALGLSGNKEGVGFAEQVGSASGTEASRSMRARNQGEGEVKEEEAKPPGILTALKQVLGLGTSIEDVKQNRRGGEGATGTGTGVGMDAGTKAKMEGTATKTGGSPYPDSSRKPKERTHGDQNEHLRHKKSSRDRDSGSGNAAEEPFLPSHRDTSGEAKEEFEG